MIKHPPERSFGHMMREVNALLQRELRERIKQYGVSLSQWYALRVLWIQDGLTQSEIAQRAGVAPPQIVAGLRILIKKGIVIRDKHPTDQRKNVIFLTKSGRQLEPLCLKEAIAVNDLALAGVSSRDFETSMRVLHRAKLNLGPQTTDLAAWGERETADDEDLPAEA